MRHALTLAALLLPTAALAHPGGHGGFGLSGLMAHAMASADHLALGLAFLAGAGLLYRRYRSQS